MAKTTRKRTRRPSEVEELESAYRSMAGTQRGRAAKPGSHNHTAAIIAVIAAMIAIGFGIAAGYVYFQNADLDGIILENVSVAGVDVGGMSQADAIDAVRTATAHTYSDVPMVVTVLDSKATIPVSCVGKLDVRSAVKAAYRFGNSGSAEKKQQEQQIAMTSGYAVDLTPYLDLDEEEIRQILAQLGAKYSTTLTQSSYSITGTAPKQTLVISLGVPEYGLDLNALYTQVLAAYSANTFTVEGQCGIIAPERIDLDAIYQQQYTTPVNAYYDPQTGTVVDGVDGYGFDLELAKQRLADAEYGSTIEIPLQPIPPEITGESLSSLLFRDTLGTYTAIADSDKDRDVNLRLACEAIDGLILDPGEVFSYNDTLGERTSARGYRPGPSYSGNKTVYTIGGGICQVSSALYYCVLKAELEIVSRKNHSFMPEYMPVGLDATVSWGTIDFLFKNDLDYPVRIEAAATGGKVVVSIVGTELRDYDVKLESDILSKTDYKTTYETMAPDNSNGYKNGDVITEPYTGYDVKTYLVKYEKDTDIELSRELIARSKYRKRDAVICKIEIPTDSTESPNTGSDGFADNPDT